MTTITRRSALATVAAAAIAPRSAVSQTLAPAFPARQIRIVVPYPAGGPTDALARIVARELQSALGQAAIVENKPGASGAIGTREVARSGADGHTLVLGTNQTHVTNAWLLREPGYDAAKDFVPVIGLADLQHALVVRKSLAFSNVADLITMARNAPDKLNYGSTGLGSGSHLTMELFQARTGIRMTHVPFRGAAPMVLELVAGRIDCAFATLPSVLGQIQGSELIALALASNQRAPQLPDLGLLKDRGVKDSEGDAWLALFAPANTPGPVVERLGQAIAAAMSKPDVRDAATKLGIAVNVRDGGAFAAYLQSETRKWADVVRLAAVKPE